MFKEPGGNRSPALLLFSAFLRLCGQFVPVLRRFRGLVLPHSAVRPGAHPSAAGSMRKENSRSSSALTR